MSVSKKTAKQFFKQHHLPRRVRDPDYEAFYRAKYDKSQLHYRRVIFNEPDRGELYPVWTAFYNTFADFGIGIGIYFTQLLVLSVVCFIAGGILVIGAYEYSLPDYGINDRSDPFLSITAACPNSINVTATVGCSTGQQNCTAEYLPNCNIPGSVILADLTMSLLFAFVIFASKLLEDRIEETLDEKIQTISDYSVEVLDPEKDADNPDEWYEFFSRFGSVRYISIIRKNEEIVYNSFEKHKVFHKLQKLEEQYDTVTATHLPDAITNTSSLTKQQQFEKKYHKILQKKITKLHKKLDKIETTLSKEYLKTYSVCRVFVTFENEEEQRLCLQALEVPDIYAIFDIRNLSNMKNLFRSENVLNVIHPGEPDNILWDHLSNGYSIKRAFFWIFSYCLTIGCFAACWYTIIAAESLNNSIELGVIIACFDSILPMIFEICTDLTEPISETAKQADLQIRLFAARLLLSTLIPYLRSRWNETLTTQYIQQIIIVQVSVCFFTPILAFFDIANVIRRNCVAYYQAETQEELNLKWSGSEWALAEKYTAISKVLFVSLYYAILVPYSLLLAMIAFLLMFLIDRYLLLRKWKIAPMFDELVAIRLRQEAILAVAAHMYVTMRYIYSWPMDEVWYHDNIYEKVNKFPSWNTLVYNVQPWHTPAQQHYMIYYYVGMLIIFVLALYIWVFVPVGSYLYKLFFYNLKSTIGESQGIPFSAVKHNITVYEPCYPYRETKFLCSHLVDVKTEHRPSFITAYDNENHDISFYIPEVHRPHVLSIVKYYSKEFEEEYQKDNNIAVVTTMKDRFSPLPVAILRENEESEGENEIELMENGNSKRQASSTSPSAPSTPKGGGLLRQSYLSRDSYHSLPLHVELDHRTNPQDRRNHLKGILPEDLKQKIAAKDVDVAPPPPPTNHHSRRMQRFASHSISQTDDEGENSNRGSRSLFRQSIKITPQSSDSPPKENYRKRNF